MKEQKRQAGGSIVPGVGSGDSHHTMLPAGSFILNRNATSAFGFNAGGVVPVALEPRERVFLPHEVNAIGLGRLQAMNAAVPRFGRPEHHQTGGLAGGFNVDGAKPGFVPFMNYLNNLFGPIYVMSGNRPGSTIAGSGRTSNHAAGNAVDISTTQNGLNFATNAASLNATGAAAARMDALYAHMARYIPTSRVSGDFLWRTFTGGNHYNHIHRGITNGLQENPAAMMQFLSTLPQGSGFAQIGKLLVDGPEGALRAVAQASLDRARKAATAYTASVSSTPTFGTGIIQTMPHAGKVVGKVSTFGPPTEGAEYDSVGRLQLRGRSGAQHRAGYRLRMEQLDHRRLGPKPHEVPRRAPRSPRRTARHR